MKKKLYFLCSALVLAVAYMLIVWFFVPASQYNDFFATEQIMRGLIPKSSLFVLFAVLPLQLVIMALFLFLLKKQKLVYRLLLPSICAFILNVLLIKPKLIGLGGDTYAPHTLLYTTPTDLFNVTMFDILFAICVGIITAIITIWLLPVGSCHRR